MPSLLRPCSHAGCSRPRQGIYIIYGSPVHGRAEDSGSLSTSELGLKWLEGPDRRPTPFTAYEFVQRPSWSSRDPCGYRSSPARPMLGVCTQHRCLDPNLLVQRIERRELILDSSTSSCSNDPCAGLPKWLSLAR